MSTNLVGNVTELQCATEFMKLGYQVSLPIGGQARYDFLADLNGKIIRVQVKSPSKVTEDSFSISCRNSHYVKGHHRHTTYSKDEIDFFSTFYNGVCYLIPVKECSTEKKLRLKPPKNCQNANVSLAKDYILEVTLNKIL